LPQKLRTEVKNLVFNQLCACREIPIRRTWGNAGLVDDQQLGISFFCFATGSFLPVAVRLTYQMKAVDT